MRPQLIRYNTAIIKITSGSGTRQPHISSIRATKVYQWNRDPRGSGKFSLLLHITYFHTQVRFRVNHLKSSFGWAISGQATCLNLEVGSFSQVLSHNEIRFQKFSPPSPRGAFNLLWRSTLFCWLEVKGYQNVHSVLTSRNWECPLEKWWMKQLVRIDIWQAQQLNASYHCGRVFNPTDEVESLHTKKRHPVITQVARSFWHSWMFGFQFGQAPDPAYFTDWNQSSTTDL